MLRFPHALAVTASLTTGILACSDDGAPSDEEIGSIVEAGKADNFLSASAREYFVEGTTTITLDASWNGKTDALKLAEIKRLVPFKQVAIGWFLNSYIIDKEEEEANHAYGGFRALTKNGSYEDLKLEKKSDLTWAFTFRQEVGGQTDLIKAIPDAKAKGDGSYSFALIVGKPSNDELQELDTDNEWYRSSPWSDWNPSAVAADKKETLDLTIRPEPAEDDAWMEHERLMADGKLTVAIHFGWDYHSNYHLKHSKEMYDWLTKTKGFKSPVSSYDKLRHDSGPLKGSAKYHGKTVAIEVSLFWGQPGLDTDPDTAAGGKQLEKDMLESFKTREVIIFEGHSGPFYGFALANWRTTSEGDLDDSEVPNFDMLKGQYQLVVAEGCDTYGLGEAFAANKDKPALKDLDVITTTNFSNASSPATVQDVINSLIGEKGTAAPTKWSALLSKMDGESYWFTTMYGVHGLDDDPHVHPWADLTKSCKTCTTNTACGDGMKCVKMADGKSACAAECTATLGCGAGYECRNVATGTSLTNKVCAPTGLKCGVPVPTQVGKAVVNEILAAPNGDYNADGSQSASQDEYVEVVNAGAAALNLTGWSISDAVGVRHVFGNGSTIPPGGALVVFGGGAPALVAGTTLVQKASSGQLGLNDGGDTVVLADIDGRQVARIVYPSGIAKGSSWQRAKDLDESSAFSAQAATPGVTRTGANF